MASVDVSQDRETHFLWLEITGSCQLECGHCYAQSGPSGGHGSMTEQMWLDTISEAARSGITQVQFIGGEPTANPALPVLVAHALDQGLAVEVFSNLFHVGARTWSTLEHPGVSLATSYYSSIESEHDAITTRVGSFARTRANIAEAVRRGISIRVGVVRLTEEQRSDDAVRDLLSLGVPRDRIGRDDLRGVGRGRSETDIVTESQLCGKCTDGVAAVMPDGTVQPCVFTRDSRFAAGTIGRDGLQSILAGQELERIRGGLDEAFTARTGPEACGPHNCYPHCFPSCQPNCSPACSPSCIPMGNCNPALGR